MRWLTLAMVALACALLAVEWPSIPDRWIAHWGVAGTPDGYAQKSIVEVFWPLAVAFALWSLTELSIVLMRRLSSHGAAESMGGALRTVTFGISATLTLTALWLPLLQPRSSWPFVSAVAIVMLGSLAIAIRQSMRGGPSDPSGWQGLIYRNPNDDRLWVPKRSGLGMTLNFAHPEARTTLAVLMLPAVLIVLAVAATMVLSARR
jgi:uncharacterized membrane protein